MTSDIEVQKLSLYDHILFILITFIYWFSLYIYVPVFVSYLDYLGGTYTFVGFIVGSYGIMQILLRLPVGVVSDRLQIRKPFVIAGLVTGVISCLGFALTESIEFALVSRFISGITASMWVAFTVLYASYFKQEDTTRAMGNVQFITVASQLISMGLSGYLVTQWGWKSPFWIGGFVGIFGIMLALRIKESKQKKSESKKIRMSELNEVLREPTVLKAAILSALAHAVLFITMFGFTPDYALKIGASKESLIFLVGSFMIPHAIAPIITGRYLAGYFQKWKILVVGFFGTFVFSVIIPFINNLGFLYLTQAFNGFAQGMTIPLLMGMAIQTIPNRKRATAMGLFQAVYAIGIFLGPFISGLFSEEGTFLPVFLTAGAAGIIGMLLSLKWGYQHSPLSKKKIESM
ncbi:MFS transporter [Metabacillus halosaccharovorans]|uniref:MFS transporter n=1 Tax=Metabacillus halosaccharovorans TaxID=930124 RepID=UPI0034D00395